MSCVGYVNYTEYLEGLKGVLTEEQYKDYCVGLVEYTTFGIATPKDPIVHAILLDRATAIEKTDNHYKDCIWYGHLGGRKRCFTEEQMYNAIKEKGIYTLKGLADYFKCSVRTINRYISSRELKNLKEIHHRG
jgi:hypothetical protein